MTLRIARRPGPSRPRGGSSSPDGCVLQTISAGRRSAGLATAAGVCPLENRHVVSHEALRPRIPLGVRNARPVIRSDVKVVVLGSARRREIGVTHPTVAADRHGVRPRKPLLRCGPRHPAKAASQFVRQSLRRCVGGWQTAEQRMNTQRLCRCRQDDRSLEHLRWRPCRPARSSSPAALAGLRPAAPASLPRSIPEQHRLRWT